MPRAQPRREPRTVTVTLERQTLAVVDDEVRARKSARLERRTKLTEAELDEANQLVKTRGAEVAQAFIARCLGTDEAERLVGRATRSAVVEEWLGAIAKGRLTKRKP